MRVNQSTHAEQVRSDAALILSALPATDDTALALRILPSVIADGNVTARAAVDAALFRVAIAQQGTRRTERAQYITEHAYPIAGQVQCVPMSDEEYDALRRACRAYCHAVDATRSRKRAADAWEDAAQDAVLLFSELLRKSADWTVAACDIDTHAASHWQYLSKRAEDESDTRVISRATLRRWAISDAAHRNGYRLDTGKDRQGNLIAEPMPGDSQVIAVKGHAQHWQTSDLRTAGVSEAARHTWEAARRMAGATPVLDTLLMYGSAADDLGRAPVWAETTRAIEHLSKRNTRAEARVRTRAEQEWARVADALSDIRHAMPQSATQTLSD